MKTQQSVFKGEYYTDLWQHMSTMRDGSSSEHQSLMLTTRHCLHVCVGSWRQPLPSQTNDVQSCGQLIEKARMTWKEDWDQLRTTPSVPPRFQFHTVQLSWQNHSFALTTHLQQSFQSNFVWRLSINICRCLVTNWENRFGGSSSTESLTFILKKRTSEPTEPVQGLRAAHLPRRFLPLPPALTAPWR